MRGRLRGFAARARSRSGCERSPWIEIASTPSSSRPRNGAERVAQRAGAGVHLDGHRVGVDGDAIQAMQTLAMAGGRFEIKLEPLADGGAHGLDVRGDGADQTAQRRERRPAPGCRRTRFAVPDPASKSMRWQGWYKPATTGRWRFFSGVIAPSVQLNRAMEGFLQSRIVDGATVGF